MFNTIRVFVFSLAVLFLLSASAPSIMGQSPTDTYPEEPAVLLIPQTGNTVGSNYQLVGIAVLITAACTGDLRITGSIAGTGVNFEVDASNLRDGQVKWLPINKFIPAGQHVIVWNPVVNASSSTCNFGGSGKYFPIYPTKFTVGAHGDVLARNNTGQLIGGFYDLTGREDPFYAFGFIAPSSAIVFAGQIFPNGTSTLYRKGGSSSTQTSSYGYHIYKTPSGGLTERLPTFVCVVSLAAATCQDGPLTVVRQ